METSREGRPFESLDWYRQASREGFRERRGTAFGRWLRSIGSVALHLSLFSAGLVLLYIVNLVRSPERLWVDRAAWAWMILLGIHALVLGIIWAVDMLRDDDVDEPLKVADVAWRQAVPWPGPPADVADRPATAPPAGSTSPPEPSGEPSPMVEANPWAGWASSSPPEPTGERSSWKEATGWLTRRRGDDASPPEPSPSPRPTVDDKDARPGT